MMSLALLGVVTLVVAALSRSADQPVTGASVVTATAGSCVGASASVCAAQPPLGANLLQGGIRLDGSIIRTSEDAAETATESVPRQRAWLDAREWLNLRFRLTREWLNDRSELSAREWLSARLGLSKDSTAMLVIIAALVMCVFLVIVICFVQPLISQTGDSNVMVSSGQRPPSSYANAWSPNRSGRAEIPAIPILGASPPSLPTTPQTRMVQPGGVRAMPAMDVSNMEHLCAELVVPEASECTLLVSRIGVFGLGLNWITDGLQPVNDARGNPVFQTKCAPSLAGVSLGGGAAGGAQRFFLLLSATGDQMFAYFCVGAQRSVEIHHSSHALFGELKRRSSFDAVESTKVGVSQCMEQPNYVITQKDSRMYLQAESYDNSFRATDDQGRLLAIVEPTQERGGQRSVTIGPRVDVGLVVIAMLGIDYLENEASL